MIVSLVCDHAFHLQLVALLVACPDHTLPELLVRSSPYPVGATSFSNSIFDTISSLRDRGLVSSSLFLVFVLLFNHGIGFVSSIKPLQFPKKTVVILQTLYRQWFARENILCLYADYFVFRASSSTV